MNQTGPLCDAAEVTIHLAHIKKKVKGTVVGTDANGVFLRTNKTGASLYFPWNSITFISYKMG